MLFNRFIEIVIRNFETKEEFKVSSEQGFRIDFDYNEHLDQSSSSNTGTIKIYNLSIATFEKIGTRFKTEVEIWCGYRNKELDTVGRLCIGGLTSKSRVRDGADHITTIEFQTAIRQLQVTNKMSVSYQPKTTMLYVLGDVSDKSGFEYALKITEEDKERFGIDIIQKLEKLNFPHGVSFTGTPKQIFDQLAEMFSLGYNIDPSNAKNIIWFVAENGFHKLKSISESLHSGNDVKKKIDIIDDSAKAIVLKSDTGLVDMPFIETVETNTGYFEALDDNEELISQKAVVVKKNKKGEVLKDKKGNIKYTKPAKSKKIARVVVNAKALINPTIKPNSWVKLVNTFNRVDGLYRVRNIKYKASTHELSSFIMDMTLTLMKEVGE